MPIINNRIRRLVASPDEGSDVLVLTDEPTVSVFHYLSSANSFSRRTEDPSELTSAPIDAAWCPYKSGDDNNSYLATAWGSPIQLLDVEDGAPRSCYYAANTMDEVCYAQSLCWLRAPTRREQFVAGYGRATECCLALFDIMKPGKCPIYTYEPTSAKCCNYAADASSSAVVVSALAEVRNNLVAMGVLRGAIELVDLRSKCCAGAISGWTASGSSNTFKAGSPYLRHKAGVVQILALDGPSLSVSTPSLVTSSTPQQPSVTQTPSDDHRFITVPRCGDDNVLAWDMRKLSNPLTAIHRGSIPDNTFRNVAILGSQLMIPTATQGLAALPLSAVFSGTLAGNGSYDGSTTVLSATDFLRQDISVVSINVSSGDSAHSSPANTCGPITVVGSSVVTAAVDNGHGIITRKFLADGSGLGHKRWRQGAAMGDDSDEDYVVARSRNVFKNAAHQKVVLSDDE